MSIPAKHWALAQDVKGSSANRIVLNQLADWMIGETAVECWPSLETLVFETGLNRQTVMKATAALEAMGLIVKKKVHKNFRWHTRYSFVGFDPNEWKNTSRPDHCGPASDFPIEEDIEGTDSRTSEGVDFHTSEGTKSHTVEGTENQLFGRPKNQLFVRPVFRTRTRNRQEIRQEEQEEREHARESEPPPPTDSDLEAMTAGEDLFTASGQKLEEPEPPPEEEAPKPKKRTRRAKPRVPVPFGPYDAIPSDWLTEFSERFPTLDICQEFSKFVNNAISKDVRNAEWKAAFRNWLTNSLTYENQKKGNRYESDSRPVQGPRRFAADSYLGNDGRRPDYGYGIDENFRPIRMPG